MNKETVKEILHILLAILLGIMAVRFVIWLLPVILIAICSYYIYKSIKKITKPKPKYKETTKKKTKKDKTIKIIEMVEDND